jgi:hypothetical protein
VDRHALTNGNQRRTALDVALAGGITHEQYAELCEVATTHSVVGLGDTATLRLANVRHLVREGLLTKVGINGFIANMKTSPHDESMEAFVLRILAEIATVALALSDNVAQLTQRDTHAIAEVCDILNDIVARRSGEHVVFNDS